MGPDEMRPGDSRSAAGRTYAASGRSGRVAIQDNAVDSAGVEGNKFGRWVLVFG